MCLVLLFCAVRIYTDSLWHTVYFLRYSGYQGGGHSRFIFVDYESLQTIMDFHLLGKQLISGAFVWVSGCVRQLGLRVDTRRPSFTL